MTKFKELILSRRFQLLTLAAAVWICGNMGWLPQEITTVIIAWATTAVGVGTIDKLADK